MVTADGVLYFENYMLILITVYVDGHGLEIVMLLTKGWLVMKIKMIVDKL